MSATSSVKTSMEFPLSSLAWTAIVSGCVCAALQAVSWRNQRVARFLAALPVLVVVLVFLAMTNSESDNNCLARAREELESYLIYSLISIVFVLVWLACINQAVLRIRSVKLGVCVSGAFALVVWLICMSVLLLFVLA